MCRVLFLTVVSQMKASVLALKKGAVLLTTFSTPFDRSGDRIVSYHFYLSPADTPEMTVRF